ncbi:MAG: NAD(P)H-dependent oxidoreductase [Acidobacteria bacterium]|nr:NAD(P)H-dependent oxidoreductase [Acidobacteriota bacterium]MYI75814.1 NAD(P)H-dependent oxidoreductase [Acidobacteriota bacterium]
MSAAAEPPTVLVVSCSLSATSRSRVLAEAAVAALRRQGVSAGLIDLQEWDLPLCDGGDCYDHPSVAPLTRRIQAAAAVLVASPIYNYDVNAAAKNLVELTGSAWSDKPVGFLCTAGGRRSYMAPIGLANSLMFDFRSLVVPRFVYAVKEDFDESGAVTDPLRERVEQLAAAAFDLARALEWLHAPAGRQA